MKVGDKVEWSSQAGGGTTTKRGEIVAVIPARLPPHRVLTKEQKDMPRRFDGSSRDHESYVVAVKVGKTDKSSPALYWPRVSALKPVE